MTTSKRVELGDGGAGQLTWQQAMLLPIPTGLGPEEEIEWLLEVGVSRVTAINAVSERHDDWPPPGVELSALHPSDAEARRVELDGGGFALWHEDEHRQVEIVEHDREGRQVRRTYGSIGEPLIYDFEQAMALVVPEGLTPDEEHAWLVEQRVASWVAVGVVNARHPEWPGEIEFTARP